MVQIWIDFFKFFLNLIIPQGNEAGFDKEFYATE